MSPATRMSRVERLEAALSRFSVRLVLSVLIIASLVPHSREDATDLVFLAVFGLELALRTVVFVARLKRPTEETRARTARRRALSGLSLLLDLLALLSFLPWTALLGPGAGLTETRILRIFRLLRLLMLIGYWSPVLRDGLAVLARHDRMRQLGMLGVIVGLLAFSGATVVSHIPVDVDFDGDTRLDADDAHFWPRLWWAFRQIQDAGNLVDDPGEVAIVVVSLLLTLAGLFVVSFLIGLATDIVRELVEIARNRPVGWRQHTIIVHATPGLPRLLSELIAAYEKVFRRPRFVVADLAEEPPPALRTGELGRVRWRRTDERGTGLVETTDAATARRVVIHARPEAPFPDALVAATMLDVREATATAWMVAEVLDPNSIAAARVAGGTRTIVVPTEKLLGLWALAQVRHPEQIPLAWELLATRGGYEIYTFFYDADGLDGPGTPWRPGATDFAGLMAAALDGSWRDARAKRLGRVLPIGVVLGAAGEAAPEGTRLGHERGELVLNPRGALGRADRPVRAIVAIAEHFEGLRRFGLHLLEGQPAGTVPRGALGVPELGSAKPPRAPRQILVGGFRTGTAVTCAGLCAEGRDVEITLVMRHEESVRVASQVLREHGSATPSGAGGSRARCFAGAFEEAEGDTAAGALFRWRAEDGREGGTVRLVQADWTSERTLSGRERGVRHVGSYELVLMLGAHLAEYDGRTSMAVLKIADLMRLEPGRFPKEHGAFRVVAGVADGELGRRLAEGFRRATGHELEVLPAEALRSLFMFQSVAVPAWEAIYTELLGSGGQGFVRLPVARPRGGASAGNERTWRLGELVQAYIADGLVIVAVELVRGEGTERVLVPAHEHELVREGELVAVWALGPEDEASAA